MADPTPFIIDELRDKTAALVLQANADLPQKVSARLANDIIAEREQLLFEGVKKYDELRKEVAKANKPDNAVQQRRPDGTFERVEQFSDAGAKKLREAEDRLAKFKAAYAKALDKDKPDYEPLKKALKGGQQGGAGNLIDESASD